MLTRKLSRLCLALTFGVTVMLAAAVGPAEATHNRGAQTSGGGSSSSSGSKELVVYDWNKPVTKAHRGFPWFQPPQQNGNWKSPVNYAEGTYYVRVQIKKQPKAQNMRMQFCLWQDNLHLENCSSMASVKGTPGTVVTWSLPVSQMWKKNGKSIDYSRPRQRISAAIKTSAQKPVSDFGKFGWAGQNPDHWYPLDMRMTIVLVAKGSKFSGWSKFIR